MNGIKILYCKFYQVVTVLLEYTDCFVTILSTLCTLCFQLAVHASIALVGRCLELNMNITKELLGFFIDTSHYSTVYPAILHLNVCYQLSFTLQLVLNVLQYSYVFIMKFSSSATQLDLDLTSIFIIIATHNLYRTTQKCA